MDTSQDFKLLFGQKNTLPSSISENYFNTKFDTERKPEHGLLLMFPGWVKHGVKKKKFEGERYCVSANLQNVASFMHSALGTKTSWRI